MYTQTIKIIKISVVSIALSVGSSYAYAWTAPTVAPTGGNTPAPLNTGTANQTKTGGLLSVFNLWIDGALGVTGGASFGGNVTVGGSSVCRQNGTNCPASSGVSGSGTASYLPQWSSASALGNSTISDNGSYYTMSSRGLYVPNSWVIANDLRSRAGYVYMGGSDLNAVQGTDSWLRLNQQSQFSSGVYTPTLMRADGGFNSGGNTVIDAGGGWHRTYGNTGWYNGTYGGGWWMTDSSWIRAYNNKNVYTPGVMQAGTVRSDSALIANGNVYINGYAPLTAACTFDLRFTGQNGDGGIGGEGGNCTVNNNNAITCTNSNGFDWKVKAKVCFTCNGGGSWTCGNESAIGLYESD